MTMADADVLSPTDAIHSFLRSRGMQPTAENVRRVLSQNAREPGAIPGLYNEAPPAAEGSSNGKTDPSVGQGGNAANKIEKNNNLPLPPPAPPGAPKAAASEAPSTTAAATPTDDGGVGLGSIATAIAAALGIGGAGMGAKMLFSNRDAPAAAPGAPNVTIPPTTPPAPAEEDLSSFMRNAGAGLRDNALRPMGNGNGINWSGMGDPELAIPPAVSAPQAPQAPPAADTPPISMVNDGLAGKPGVTIQAPPGNVSGTNPIQLGAQFPNRPTDVIPPKGMAAWSGEAHAAQPFVNDILKLLSHAR